MKGLYEDLEDEDEFQAPKEPLTLQRFIHLISNSQADYDGYPLWRKLLYSSGRFGAQFMMTISAFFMVPFMLNVVRINPFNVGLMMLIRQLFDGFADPVMGVISDSFDSKFGRRKPWIALGIIPMAILWVFLWYNPGFMKNSSDTTLTIYFIILLLIYSMFKTIVEVPYQALSMDITNSEEERMGIVVSQNMFGMIGTIVSSFIWVAIIMAFPSKTNAMYPDLSKGYLVAALVSVVLIVPPICVGALAVREIYWESDDEEETDPDHISNFADSNTPKKGSSPKHNEDSANNNNINNTGFLRSVANYIIQSKVFLYFSRQKFCQNLVYHIEGIGSVLRFSPFLTSIAILACQGLTIGIYTQNFILFCEVVLKEDKQAKFILLAQEVSVFLGFIFWYVFGKKFGKYATYVLGMLCCCVTSGGMIFLGTKDLLWAFILCSLRGFFASVGFVIPWAMLLDVSALDSNIHGIKREGLIFASQLLIDKIVLAGGQMISSWSLSFAGYVEPTSDDGPLPQQPRSVIITLKLLICVVPIVLILLSFVFVYLYRKYYNRISSQFIDEAKKKYNMDDYDDYGDDEYGNNIGYSYNSYRRTVDHLNNNASHTSEMDEKSPLLSPHH